MRHTHTFAVLLASGTLLIGGQPLLAEEIGYESIAASSFDMLDADSNGTISQSEATASPQLVEQWAEYDIDQNGALDMSEFAAFEQQLIDQPTESVPEE